MTIQLEPKRANEVLTFVHDWSGFLGSDTIQSQTTQGSGVTVTNDAVANANTGVTFKLSAGTNGTVGIVTQTIVTAGGETQTELFTIAIVEEDPISLQEAKDYLRVRDSEEDQKILGMIGPAIRWVEDHTGLAFTRRQFTEYHRPGYDGSMFLSKGPVVSIDDLTYLDSAGVEQSYTPRLTGSSNKLLPGGAADWPSLGQHEVFTVTYTAGHAVGAVDERLKKAALALIEGEYADGYAYPERSTQAATRCCAYLTQTVGL